VASEDLSVDHAKFFTQNEKDENSAAALSVPIWFIKSVTKA